MLSTSVYLGGALAVTVAAHAYLRHKIVRDLNVNDRWEVYITRGLWLAAALLPVGMTELSFRGRVPRAISSPLMWVSFTWIGALFFLLLLLLMRDMLMLIVFRTQSKNYQFRKLGATASFIGAGVLTILALIGGLKDAAIVHQDIEITNLSKQLAGYRIAHLSDLHVGPTIGGGFVEDIVKRVNALDPDLIVITGDLVDGPVDMVGPLLASLRDLKSHDGVFMVLGNHEYLSGAESWMSFLPSLGIRVLRNQAVSLHGKDGFDLIGIDELSAMDFDGIHHPDYDVAFEGLDSDRPKIVLAHQPRLIDFSKKYNAALQLSGHTHGGQIFPLQVLALYDQSYLAGLYRVDNTQLYVSSGSGYWGPPMRLMSASEIALISLSRPGLENDINVEVVYHDKI